MITAYQFGKVVNIVLEELEVEKVLPVQMFYTYYKKNMIKDEQKTMEGAVEWTKQYVERQKNKGASVSRDAIKALLSK